MSYSSEVKILRGSQGTIESEIKSYLATIASGSIFCLDATKYGADQLLVIIVHDA